RHLSKLPALRLRDREPSVLPDVRRLGPDQFPPAHATSQEKAAREAERIGQRRDSPDLLIVETLWRLLLEHWQKALWDRRGVDVAGVRRPSEHAARVRQEMAHSAGLQPLPLQVKPILPHAILREISCERIPQKRAQVPINRVRGGDDISRDAS